MLSGGCSDGILNPLEIDDEPLMRGPIDSSFEHLSLDLVERFQYA